MNIIFDLGGVVVRWDPRAIAERVFSDPEERDVACVDVLGHPDWIEVDRGTLSPEDFAAKAAQRTGLPRARVTALVDAVPPSLTPIEGTVDLIRRLAARGHDLYCLSNMGAASIAFLEARDDIWPLFRGVVISSRVKMCKPDPAIFAHLLSTYGLDPAHTLFIDDTAANTAAASEVGMQTIRFESPAQCERELLAAGCL
jgi:putative hydrolase of the HAD superfamily